MTRVLMISGSWPPQACGVGDYTDALCAHLNQAGLAVERFGDRRFSTLCSPRILAEIARSDCDLVHIQYPTAGFGRSLTPSAIAFSARAPVVVTLHEYAAFRAYRRPWFAPFARYCRARIFTTTFEQELFRTRFPRRRGSDAIIEIASNVPEGRPAPRRGDKVAYFGLIAPHKGIEDFLDFCAIARERSNGLALGLVGAVPTSHRVYADAILQRARSLDVSVRTDLPRERVADELASATFAYLPFPDGASLKRGSLVAAMVNGMAVVTPHGPRTPDWMRDTTIGAPSPRDALDAVKTLIRDPEALRTLMTRTRAAAQRFSWTTVARRHVVLYDQVLGAHAGSSRMPAG